ncbi:unnamed protein product [Alternaria alternata]
MARINLPPLTRGVLAAVVIFTLINFALRPHADWVENVEKPMIGVGNGVPWLTIVPGYSVPWYPWVFALATVVEQNVLGLVTTALTVFYGGRYLERAWASHEFTKFMLFVATIPNVLDILALHGSASSSRAKVPSCEHTTISGGIAIQAGFLVSFKQLVPEHTVAIAKGLIRMRVKHFPAIFLLANTISGMILGTETAMFLAYFGFFTAWIYLRFYRISPSLSSTATGDGFVIRGDASDTFSFAHFFPEPIQTPVGALSDGIYNALVSLKVQAPVPKEVSQAIMNPNSRGGRGGSTRVEAERRRALALEALNARLNAAASRGPSAAAPSAPSVSGPTESLGETTYEPERHEIPERPTAS